MPGAPVQSTRRPPDLTRTRVRDGQAIASTVGKGAVPAVPLLSECHGTCAGRQGPRAAFRQRTDDRVRQETKVSNEPAAPETRGVAVQVLATVDLAGEIDGMEGRQLRMRMVTIEPGGVFGPTHDHASRPGVVYVLQGTVTDHRDGVATDYGPGVGWPHLPRASRPVGARGHRRASRTTTRRNHASCQPSP